MADAILLTAGAIIAVALLAWWLHLRRAKRRAAKPRSASGNPTDSARLSEALPRNLNIDGGGGDASD